MQLLIASGNQDKIAEMRTVAEGYEIALLSPAEVREQKQLPPPPEVEESAPHFYGNAGLKAQGYAAWAQMPALADDSGLAVDMLDGRPGVHSARYGGAGLSDKQRCQRLLEEIQSLDGFAAQAPTARFHCALVVVDGSRELASVEVQLPGKVLAEFRGENGFGYDPIIEIDGLSKTLAELSFEEVCQIGFRAQALFKLFEQLGIQKKVRG